MSIEKKSLISNRIASKKAIVTKPEGSKVASNKLIVARTHAVPRVLARSAAINKVAVNKIAINKIGMSKIAINKVSVNKVAVN